MKPLRCQCDQESYQHRANQCQGTPYARFIRKERNTTKLLWLCDHCDFASDVEIQKESDD